MIPVNGYLATKSRIYGEEQMNVKDARTKIIDEFLSGVKVIKLYAWEIPFLNKINSVRETELSLLKKLAYLTTFQT